ncbi:MAG TPA: cytochrome C oxidase subunit IV family protein [Acidimicrobiales bacterium]|nr:cytochrome C oxidase subunit IV family protein [Acidimicrobiales bacterium]
MATEPGTSAAERPAPDSGAVTEEAQPDHDPTAPDHAHPSEWEYIKVALFLAVVTAAEVGIYYVEQLEDFLVPLLLVFAVIKFAMVALWFMHLRFDSRIFRRLFAIGLLLALFAYAVVLATFEVWNR